VDPLPAASSPTESARKDAGRLIREGIEALDLEWSAKITPLKSRSELDLSDSPRKSAKQQGMDRRKSTRSTGEKLEIVSDITRKLALGKRKLEDGLSKAKRELRNLADTKEFAKIDTAPVIHEVWSKGKLVVPEPPQKKKRKLEEESAPQKSKAEELKPVEKKLPVGKRQKVWLNKGLYAGQEAEKFDWFSSYTAEEKENMPTTQPYKENKYFPMPMWHGQRLLHIGRDFKLPFDVCSPLPPGQPKPDEWRKTSSSKLNFRSTIYTANFTPRSIYRQCCCAMEEVNSV
jgi:histone-lysine N-methyltransferase ASH1L